MLKIRLARAGRHKTPFYRIVLTEHTRPIQSGYQTVLGWYDPLKHVVNIDVETSKAWIAKGATPTSRVAKILHKHTGDDSFKKYIVITERTRKVKNAPAEEEAPKAAPEAPVEKAPELPAETAPEAPVDKAPEASSEAPVEATPETPTETPSEVAAETTPEPAVEPTPEVKEEAPTPEEVKE